MSVDIVDHTSLAQPIQDQGQCGSCTAFGLTGVIEARYFQKYSKQIKLSEKDLFFCSGGKCNDGNTMEAPLNYAQNNGIATEECCPYGNAASGTNSSCGDGRCGEWWVDGVKIASWQQLTTQAERDVAMREGPIFIAMAVYQSFMNYAGGIYHPLGDFDPIIGYHAVGCFGKNFTEGWIEVRNSWGVEWGEQSLSNKYGEEGWFRAVDEPTIFCEYYRVEINGPIPEPEPQPSPCQRGNAVAKIMNFIPWILGRRGRFYYLNRR